MSDWISQIARELEATEEFVNEFLITYVRERTKRRVSPQEILEAIRVVKTHPPLERQHPKKTRTNTTEAVILYLRNPVRYTKCKRSNIKSKRN